MGPSSQYVCRSRRRVAVSLTLICALLLISGLLYSPWHRHDAASRRVCIFSQFEGGSMLEPVLGIQLEPQVGVSWLAPDLETARSVICFSCRYFGRAPPA